MLQWFIRFPVFTEFSFRENSNVSKIQARQLSFVSSVRNFVPVFIFKTVISVSESIKCLIIMLPELHICFHSFFRSNGKFSHSNYNYDLCSCYFSYLHNSSYHFEPIPGHSLQWAVLDLCCSNLKQICIYVLSITVHKLPFRIVVWSTLTQVIS